MVCNSFSLVHSINELRQCRHNNRLVVIIEPFKLVLEIILLFLNVAQLPMNAFAAAFNLLLKFVDITVSLFAFDEGICLSFNLRIDLLHLLYEFLVTALSNPTVGNRILIEKCFYFLLEQIRLLQPVFGIVDHIICLLYLIFEILGLNVYPLQFLFNGICLLPNWLIHNVHYNHFLLFQICKISFDQFWKCLYLILVYHLAKILVLEVV